MRQVVVVFLLCCLMVGSNWATAEKGAAVEKGAPVKVAQAHMQSIYQRVPLTGTVTSSRVARISVAVGGLVDQIMVEEGSEVAKGDMLLALDSDLVELQAQSAAAKTLQLNNAWQDAQRRLREAKALASNIAESTVRDLESEIAQDQALLQQAQADQGYQQAVLKRHKVTAPFAGVISAKLTELGEWVVPGQGVLELVSLEQVRIDFKVAEDYLEKIGPGATIRYSLNARPQQSYEAPVGTVVPVSDPGARTFLLRVPIDNKEHTMIPGLSVTAQMKVPTGREGVVVPRDAILRTPDGRVVVWVLDSGSDTPSESPSAAHTVAEKTVVTGVTYDGLVEIKQGLDDGVDIVIEGNESLQRGQKVYIVND